MSGPELYWQRRVEPTPREVATFERAVEAARRAGIVIPPGVCAVYWFRVAEWDEGDESPGVTFRHERPVLVFLRAGLSDEHLFETVVHELAHVRDRAADLDKAALEVRAEDFAARVLRLAEVELRRGRSW